MSWTKERVQFLTINWGVLTAQQIADSLGGVTRNAVIGKANRMGLSRSDKNNNQAEGPQKVLKRGRRPGSKNSTKKVLTEPNNVLDNGVLAEPTPLNLELTDLTSNTCKWPISSVEPSKYLFCGVMTDPKGGPYCPYHAEKAFHSSRSRRKSA